MRQDIFSDVPGGRYDLSYGVIAPDQYDRNPIERVFTRTGFDVSIIVERVNLASRDGFRTISIL